MTEVQAPATDLGQIRGDWHFHMNFVSNATGNTLKRAVTMWDDLDGVDEPALDELLGQLSDHWAGITSRTDDKGSIRVDGDAYQAFIDASRETKSICDELEIKHDQGGASSAQDTPLEQFTEACRQIRGMCDDLEMMREQAS